MTISKTSENIQVLFNQIAGKYDFMNNLISLGLHKNVKLNAIKMLDIKPGFRILDACCGTGDLAYIIKKREFQTEITCLDFSYKMLNIAKEKIKSVNFIQGDITKTVFPDNYFDIITMGFGLRNIQNPEKTLHEIYRILKPNGQFLHLDFGTKNFFSLIFDIETSIFANIFSENSQSYKYLIKSKRTFPLPEELIKDFERCGFKFKQRKDFIFGALSAQVMNK